MENSRRWRSFSRDEMALPVNIRTGDSFWKRIARPMRKEPAELAASGQTRNISPSGLCLRLDERDCFKVGQEVNLRFGAGADGQALKLQGRVVWTSQAVSGDPLVHLGLQITSFPNDRDQADWFGILLYGGFPGVA